MTEQQWLSATDPQQMLEFLRSSGQVSERKHRLFAVACCRRLWHLLTERQRLVVSQVERHADGLAGTVANGPSEGGDVIGVTLSQLAAGFAVECLTSARLEGVTSLCARAISEGGIDREARAVESNAQAILLRDVFNPFRPLDWTDGAAVQLAQAAYDARLLPEGLLDPSHLAVLADALEEAGCADRDMLAHLRGPGPHVRGCFALDAVLGRT